MDAKLAETQKLLRIAKVRAILATLPAGSYVAKQYQRELIRLGA